MKLLVISASLYLAGLAMSADTLGELVRSHIEERSTVEVEIKWLKKWRATAKQAMEDNADRSEDVVANEKLLDYLTQKRTELEASAKGTTPLSSIVKLELCRWVKLYLNKGWSFPERVREHVTVCNFEKWIKP